MRKIKLTEYSGILLMILCVFFIFMRFFLVAAVIYILWYALYGFVGLAIYFSKAKKIKLSNLLLKVTFHPTLLPFRKSLYFWAKSDNVITKDPAHTEKALSLAKKVNIDALYTDNNKAVFLSHLAALYNDLGYKEKALNFINEAQSLPHKKAIDEIICRVKDEIEK